jgi:hypothetical protein
MSKFRTDGLEVNRKRRRDNSLTFARRLEGSSAPRGGLGQ